MRARRHSGNWTKDWKKAIFSIHLLLLFLSQPEKDNHRDPRQNILEKHMSMAPANGARQIPQNITSSGGCYASRLPPLLFLTMETKWSIYPLVLSHMEQMTTLSAKWKHPTAVWAFSNATRQQKQVPPYDSVESSHGWLSKTTETANSRCSIRVYYYYYYSVHVRDKFMCLCNVWCLD